MFQVRMVSRIRKSCTEHVSECCLYPRDLSPVPELAWKSFRTSESLILCRMRHSECLLVYGKRTVLMSILVNEKQKSESGAI